MFAILAATCRLSADRPRPTDETSEYPAGKRALTGGEQDQIHTRAVRVARIPLAAHVVQSAACCAQDTPDHGARGCAAPRVPRSPCDHDVGGVRRIRARVHG
jgi:hypothetical protein